MSNNSPTNEDLIALQNDQEHEDSYSLTITEPVSVSRQSSLNDVIDSDIDIANNVLKALHAGWSRVRSISSLTKMADTTLNAIEKRRKILNLQYGAEAKYSKGSVVYPMD